jgi:DNA repair exonuclease SbcCD ATPase subunit
MTVNFSTTKETKTGKERMTCNISIFYKNEHYDSYTELSGGERGGLSIAVMLAINSLTDGKVIMFDETFKTLDSPFEICVLTMLKNYVGNKKICIISGHNMLEGVFDSIKHF